MAHFRPFVYSSRLVLISASTPGSGDSNRISPRLVTFATSDTDMFASAYRRNEGGGGGNSDGGGDEDASERKEFICSCSHSFVLYIPV
jgi:hypothetical protein